MNGIISVPLFYGRQAYKLKPGWNERHYTDDIFECVSLIFILWSLNEFNEINNILGTNLKVKYQNNVFWVTFYKRLTPRIKTFSWNVVSDCEWCHHVYSATRSVLNILKPRQNGRHFPDDISKCIFVNENVWISLKTWVTFVPKVRLNNIPSLVQIMAWRRPGDKPLSEPMVVSLLTHVCVSASMN